MVTTVPRYITQWASGDTISEAEFMAFLEGAVYTVGLRLEVIAGYFRTVIVPFRHENEEVNYAEVYTEELRQYIKIRTVN
jgi:hypothetical protein